MGNSGISRRNPPLFASLLPIILLLAVIVYIIVTRGADVAQSVSHYVLFGVAVFTALLSRLFYKRKIKYLAIGLRKSAKQILPAIPILILIGTVSATWMMSGAVPAMIDYGLQILNPRLFLLITCVVCAIISVMSGSSWTTIATIGVAFMGIGTVFGYAPGWVAGAIISGAYFGDKVSPLSDTTVLASSSCEVDLFKHIRYMMITTVPSMIIALLVFLIFGFISDVNDVSESLEIVKDLNATYNITPWSLSIPVITCVLIGFRVKTLLTLILSTVLGLLGMFIFQPEIASSIYGGEVAGLYSYFYVSCDVLFTSTEIETGNEMLNSLVATSGVEGMMSTIYLVICAMCFGGMMLGSGMLSTITHAVTNRLRTVSSIVNATVGSGLMFNSFTGDQYLSIILDANVYKKLYKRNGLESRLLSRSVEDSVSVTSVLIPWNSCGVTQSTVLGVPTLTYLPYCIFNYLSPIMSMIIARLGYKIVRRRVRNS